MRKEWLFILLLPLLGCRHKTGQPADYPVQPVTFTSVRFTDNFWAPILKRNHNITIPIAFHKAEETGRIRNFKIAGGLEQGHFCSLYPFDDSDVYKNIEGAAYSLQIYPDPILEAYLDTLIAYIAAAQEDDGYLYTNRTIDPAGTHEMAGTERWVNEELSSHELYNAGHLYEAAVAYFQATGKSSLLDVALKNVQLIEREFGWGKIEKVPGHQEIEVGLVKLYRLTGERRYLDLAKFFLDRRGPGGSEYAQMHLRPVDQDKAVGHAVRAMYMYAAMADIAALTGDRDYMAALDRIWDDVARYKTYITGGIGAAGEYEGFGRAYELPNLEAYCETCAAIANALWNHRMFLLTGNSRYVDVFERVLYNGLISGVSLSGDRFFYPNPLASDGRHERKPWFGCACCPVNLTRFLPSLPGYLYATSGRNIFINHFVQSEAKFEVDGVSVNVRQLTDYPWDGKVTIHVNPDRRRTFAVCVRIPGWSVNEVFPTDLYRFAKIDTESVVLKVNGKKYRLKLDKGYAVINRTWQSGDEISLMLPMPVRTIVSHPLVMADSGLIAAQRGPIVYAAEWTDQQDHQVDNICIEDDTVFRIEDIMISTMDLVSIAGHGPKDFRLIPYFTWANRGKGPMRVWLCKDLPDQKNETTKAID